MASQPDNSPRLDGAALAQRAREHLGAGRFRKARDDFKLLCKQDRAKYLPWLIQANKGLAEEMMAKGLVSEARQVLDYLATIASSEELRAVEVAYAVRSGDAQGALAAAWSALACASNPLPEAERRRLADQVVLSFEAPPTEPAALAGEFAALREALRAVGAGQWDQARESLRPIPHQSIVAHWKLLVRAWIAFHDGEVEKGLKCLAGVPPDSVPGKVARVFAWLEDSKPSPQAVSPTPALLEACGRLVGLRGLGAPVARSEKLWREHRVRESYLALRDGVAGFPAEGASPLGVLSQFHFNAMLTATDRHHNEMADLLCDLGRSSRFKNDLERLWVHRAFALSDPTFESYGLKEDWAGFLNAHERLHGRHPRLEAMVYCHLGEVLSRVGPNESGFFRRRGSQMRDAEGAVEALQKSVKLDPMSLEAHLSLCGLYGKLKRVAERNRLLDEMTDRFPGEKSVLILAGRRCVERGAFAKGLDYLEAARRLDLLDPAIADLMVEAYLGQVRAALLKGRNDQAQRFRAKTDPLLVDNPANLARSKWALPIRQAMLGCGAREGLVSPDAQLLAQARALSPNPESFLYYAHLAREVENGLHREEETPFSQEFRLVSLPTALLRHALPLLAIARFWQQQAPRRGFSQAFGLWRQYLTAAAKNPYTREELRQVLELEGQDLAGAVPVFVRHARKRDKKDPVLRLYELEQHVGVPLWGGPRNPAKEFKSIIQEANRRGDAETARRAEAALQAYREKPPPDFRPPPFPNGPSFADDFADPVDFSDSQGVPELDSMTPDMETLRKRILHATPAQLEALRQDAHASGVPDFLFQALVNSLKTGKADFPQFPFPGF